MKEAAEVGRSVWRSRRQQSLRSEDLCGGGSKSGDRRVGVEKAAKVGGSGGEAAEAGWPCSVELAAGVRGSMWGRQQI